MYESKGILQSYNALVTEINDQNLKDITNQIKKLCGISENENTELFKFEKCGQLSGMSMTQNSSIEN